MSDASLTTSAPTPVFTGTYTECWVYSTSNGYVFSTPAYPIATGAVCYKIFPTGGGIEMSPIPNSEVWPMNTEPAFSGAPSAQKQRSIVGPVVGSVLAILFLALLVAWFIASRERRRKAAQSKHEWALKPGKWITNEQKLGEQKVREHGKESADAHA